MINQNDEERLFDFFGGREKIDKEYKSYHPMRSFLVSPENTKRVFHTKVAFKIVLDKDRAWLENKKQSLESIDCIKSSSAFGELRAYGNLLTTFQVVPGNPDRGADFKVLENGKNECVYIEVQTKNLAQNSTIDHGATIRVNNKLRTEMTTKEIVPYGLPDCNKRNDSVCTNMISKICAIKQDETQLSDTVPSIIWVDLQDNSHMFSELEHCMPILSKNEYLTSGCIWHALYGWKGAFIYDNSAEFDRNVFMMEHDGRFRQPTKVSGFIFSFENATVLMENPWSQNKIPLWFKKGIFLLWQFSIKYSLVDYNNDTLEEYVECQRKYLNAIHSVFG